MNYLTNINFLIPTLGLIGTIILAFSVYPVFKAIKGAFKLLEMQHNMNLRNEFDKIALQDLDKHIENYGGKVGTWLVYLGLFFVAISYSLQVYLLFK